MKQLLERLVLACHYGSTRQTRILFVIREYVKEQAWYTYRELVKARVLEEHGPKQIDPWVSVTPLGVDMARNFGKLVKSVNEPAEVKSMNKKRISKKTVKVPCLSMAELVFGTETVK